MFDFNNIDLSNGDIMPVDTTGDGIADSIAVDTNNDGVFDTLLSDTNGDGNFDVMKQGIDTTGDGMFDTLVSNMDMNHDGISDELMIENEQGVSILKDTDHNGVFDEKVTVLDVDKDGREDYIETARDYNQDGLLDSRTVTIDSDLDGVFDTSIRGKDTDGSGSINDIEIQMDRDEDGKADFIQRERLIDKDSNGYYHTKIVDVDMDGDGSFEQTGVKMPTEKGDQPATMLDSMQDLRISCSENGGMNDGLGRFDPETANMENIIGNPAEAMKRWECQGETGRCALYAQKFIIEELTGQDVDMGEFLRVAKENSWFDDNGGTSTLNMNKMLDCYGIKNEMTFHNTLDDIESCLERGERVIVGIDADEIWYGENDNVFTPIDAEGLDVANHAVEVIGIDKTDPEHPIVILNDSGTPNGKGEMVPADIFCDAWDDGDCQMIRCMV